MKKIQAFQFLLCLGILIMTLTSAIGMKWRRDAGKVGKVKKGGWEALKNVYRNWIWIKKAVHHKVRPTPAPPSCLTQTLFIPLPYLKPHPVALPRPTSSPQKYRRDDPSTNSSTPTNSTPPSDPTPQPYFPPCGKGPVYSVNYFHPTDFDYSS